MREKREPRSHAYQHVFNECWIPDAALDWKPHTEALYHNRPYSERLLDLREERRQRLLMLLETSLTPRQWEVVRLLMSGLTQQEVASKLGIQQSTINKTILGNQDYGKSRGFYGGIVNKMKRIARNDEELARIAREIADIEEE